MASLLRKIFLPLAVFGSALLFFAGCAPSFPKETLIDTLYREIENDWGITPDRIKIDDDYLGLIYREEALWDTDGKLKQDVALNVANIERTMERILVSSDAGITTFSVTVAGEDSTKNLRFERSLDTIRQKRAGEISWQDSFDADNNEPVPCWRWEPFDEDYYFFQDKSADEIETYIQDQILTRYRLKSRVRISDGSLAVLFRVPRLWEGNDILPESEQLQSAVHALLSITALKTPIPLDRITVTIGANDSPENLTLADTIDAIRAQAEGTLDMETHKASLQRTRTPFWIWGENGRAGWYTPDELATRINEIFNRTLKWKPVISYAGTTLNLSFSTALDAPAGLLSGQTLSDFSSAQLSIFDAVLLTDQEIDAVTVTISSNTTAQTTCFTTSIEEIKSWKTEGTSTEAFGEYIERNLHDTCN